MRFARFGALVLAVCILAGCAKRTNIGEAYDAVRVGMTQANVLQLMGEPNKRMRLPLEGRIDQSQTVFRYLKGGHLMHVSFVNGQVVAKEKI